MLNNIKYLFQLLLYVQGKINTFKFNNLLGFVLGNVRFLCKFIRKFCFREFQSQRMVINQDYCYCYCSYCYYYFNFNFLFYSLLLQLVLRNDSYNFTIQIDLNSGKLNDIWTLSIYYTYCLQFNKPCRKSLIVYFRYSGLYHHYSLY